MTPTTWPEVAHLYVGCTVQLENSGSFVERKLIAVSRIEDLAYMRLKMINSDWTHAVMFKEKRVKPILRLLSSMTKEEAEQVGFDAYNMLRNKEGDRVIPNKDLGFRWAAKQTAYLLSHHFDLFNLIPSGQALDATTFPNQTAPEGE